MLKTAAVIIFIASLHIFAPLVRSKSLIPVVYITFGEVPYYIQANIELAARNNPVVILSDSSGFIFDHQSGSIAGPPQVNYALLRDYDGGGNAFRRAYTHLCFDKGKTRFNYEFNCFRRWFILRDYMEKHNIPVAFYGDGDSSVFANITEQFQKRSNCSAIVNVEAQASEIHWVAAGEASVWTLPAIQDLCRFFNVIYAKHIDTLRQKSRHSSLVDMSVIWLWWIKHTQLRPVDGWEVGKPFTANNLDPIDPANQVIQRRFGKAVQFARKLTTPPVNDSLWLCNGLDVVDRTAFDHLKGWQTGTGFSLNLEDGGRLGLTLMPTANASNSHRGGRPESVDAGEVRLLQRQPLQFVNVHYIGKYKEYLGYDVCRVLTLTGSRKIYNQHVQHFCTAVLDKYPKDLPCLARDGLTANGQSKVCY